MGAVFVPAARAETSYFFSEIEQPYVMTVESLNESYAVINKLLNCTGEFTSIKPIITDFSAKSVTEEGIALLGMTTAKESELLCGKKWTTYVQLNEGTNMLKWGTGSTTIIITVNGTYVTLNNDKIKATITENTGGLHSLLYLPFDNNTNFDGMGTYHFGTMYSGGAVISGFHCNLTEDNNIRSIVRCFSTNSAELNWTLYDGMSELILNFKRNTTGATKYASTWEVNTSRFGDHNCLYGANGTATDYMCPTAQVDNTRQNWTAMVNYSNTWAMSMISAAVDDGINIVEFYSPTGSGGPRRFFSGVTAWSTTFTLNENTTYERRVSFTGTNDSASGNATWTDIIRKETELVTNKPQVSAYGDIVISRYPVFVNDSSRDNNVTILMNSSYPNNKTKLWIFALLGSNVSDVWVGYGTKTCNYKVNGTYNYHPCDDLMVFNITNDTQGTAVSINMTVNSTNSFMVKIQNSSITTGGIDIMTPVSKTYNNYTLDVNVTYEMFTPDKWKLELNGEANVTFTPNTTVTGLKEGTNTLRVFANQTVTGSLYMDTVSFVFHSANYSGPVYPSMAWEGADEEFGITVLPASNVDNVTTMTMTLDGTQYTMSETSDNIFEEMETIPLITGTNKTTSLFFNFTVVLLNGTSISYGTDVYTIIINASVINITFENTTQFYYFYNLGHIVQDTGNLSWQKKRSDLGSGLVLFSFNGTSQVIGFPNALNGLIKGSIIEKFHLQTAQDKVQEVRVWDMISLIPDASVWVYEMVDNVTMLVYVTITDTTGKILLPIESGKSYMFKIYADGYQNYTGYHEIIPSSTNVLSIALQKVTEEGISYEILSTCGRVVKTETTCQISVTLSSEGNITINYNSSVQNRTSTSANTTYDMVQFIVNSTRTNYTIDVIIDNRLVQVLQIDYTTAGVTFPPDILPAGTDAKQYAFTIIFLSLLIATMIGAAIESMIPKSGMFVFCAVMVIIGGQFTVLTIAGILVTGMILIFIVKRLI